MTYDAMLLGPPMTDDTRDRLITLEVQVEDLTKVVERMAETLEKVDRVLTKADGARWAFLAIAGIAGFLSGKAEALVSAVWK